MTAAENRARAARVRELLSQAPARSLQRRALACAAIALDTTASLRAARTALEDIGPEDVRAAALTYLANEAQ